MWEFLAYSWKDTIFLPTNPYLTPPPQKKYIKKNLETLISVNIDLYIPLTKIFLIQNVCKVKINSLYVMVSLIMIWVSEAPSFRNNDSPRVCSDGEKQS